ncbi:MAG: Ig-like domain-containing protein [Oscillospiraceae bacterium]|nr:Ig-like domain-containing protein [Oscillospiraceae bacterium]
MLSMKVRVISLLLATVLCVSSMPAIVAFAAPLTTTFPSWYARDYEENGIPAMDTNYIDEGLKMTDQEIENTIEALLNTMTEREKFSFLGGGYYFSAPFDGLNSGMTNGYGIGPYGNAGILIGCPRLGVPETRMHDGPAGVFGLWPTTNPPNRQMVAANWDDELSYEYGVLAGSELRALGGTFQLGSQFDITRSPEFSRAKDQLGTDPYLLSRIAAAETKGIQDQGAVAVGKHFTAYTNASNGLISEQALHEIYLAPFESAVKESNMLAFMSAGVSVNGVRNSANAKIMNGVVRGMWGFKGLYMSDWQDTNQFCLDKGLDLEMPVSRFNTVANTKTNYPDEEERMAVIDNAVRHILYVYGKAGYLALVQTYEDGGKLYAKEDPTRTATSEGFISEDQLIRIQWDSNQGQDPIRDHNNDTALKLAEGGAVLLKNDNNALPIKSDETIAMIGMSAKILQSGIGGERSCGTGFEMTSPYDAIAAIQGADKVKLEADSDVFGEVIPAKNLFVPADASDSPSIINADGFKNGVGRYNGFSVINVNASSGAAGSWDTSLVGDFIKYDEKIQFLPAPNSYFGGDAIPNGKEYTWITYIKPEETGQYGLVLSGIGAGVKSGVNSAAMGNYNVQIHARVYSTPIKNASDTVTGSATTIASPVGNSTTSPGAQWNSGATLVTDTGMILGSVTNMNLEAGKYYKIELTGKADRADKDLQFSLSWLPPSTRGDVARARSIQLAETQDKVVIFALKTTDVGRPSTLAAGLTNLNLPATQEQLINDVATAAKAKGKKVIVVLQSSVATTMQNWIDNVDAVLLTYISGQRGGIAMANLLTGKVNPSGKLAYTIPADGNQTLMTYTQDALTRELANPTDFYEGILTDYRWYDTYGKDAGITPRYNFGFGLSYTKFTYSDLKVVRADDGSEVGYDVTFTVTNTGSVKGSEVAEAYIGQADMDLIPDGVQSAPYQLVGFEKQKDIEPGEAREVTIHLNQRAFSYWDSSRSDDNLFTYADGSTGKWTVADGERTIYVGPQHYTEPEAYPLSATVEPFVHVTGLSLNTSVIKIWMGLSANLSAIVEPANAYNKNIIWSTSDNTIAMVDQDGKVMAAANEGTAIITAKTEDGGVEAACEVTVRVTGAGDIPVDYVTLDKSALSLYTGQSVGLTATVFPGDAYNQNLQWSSSDKTVATVDENGRVTGAGEGTATIMVTTEDFGTTDSCDVTVVPGDAPVEGVALDPASLSLSEGNTATLSATIQPANAGNKSVIWSSSDESVATVSASGVVNAINEGTAIITVTTQDGGKTANCLVTVVPRGDAQLGASINAPLLLDIKSSRNLEYTISVSNAYGSNLFEVGADFDQTQLSYVGYSIELPTSFSATALLTDFDVNNGKFTITIGLMGKGVIIQTNDSMPLLKIRFYVKDGVDYGDAITGTLFSLKADKPGSDQSYQFDALIDPSSITTDITSPLKYDVDNDGQITMKDVSYIIFMYYLSASGDPDWGEAQYFDTNGDNFIDLSDIVFIISLI